MMSGDNIYLFPNAYFRQQDAHPEKLDGFEIPDGWWSRAYEYAWAIGYAGAGQKVADMGMGWHYRPFHDALSMRCDFVYGVDSHEGIMNEQEIPRMKNGAFIVADFSKPIDAIPPRSLDRIFCISVLEEVENLNGTLLEFKRLLIPDGLIILTCDMPYDKSKAEHEKYKGIGLDKLERHIKEAGLHYAFSVNRVMYEDLLHHNEFNLCVWHCVLRKI